MTSPLPIVSSPLKSAAWASSPNILASLSLMLLGHRPADVGGGEDGEDERLQRRHEHLETDERHADRERERREDRRRPALEHRDRAQEEHRQQEVARQEVGPESDRQGDRPDHDLRDELDRHEQRIEPRRGPRRQHHVQEVAAHAVTLDPDRVVGDPCDQGHDQRERDPAVRGEVDPRDDLEDVPEEDREEERREQRHELVALGPDHLQGHVLADEAHAELGDALELARDDLRAPEREVEEPDHQQEAEQDQEVDEVQAELEAADLQRPAPAIPDEVLGRWGLERRQDRAGHLGIPGRLGTVHRSACIRPASIFISTTSSATVQGTSAAMNATIENHSVCCSSAMTATITPRRTMKPPSPTAYRITGEICAASASDQPWAAKFSVTTPIAMTADQPASVPSSRVPTANATMATGIANGAMRRTSSDSGAIALAFPFTESQVHEVDRSSRSQHDPHRGE